LRHLRSRSQVRLAGAVFIIVVVLAAIGTLIGPRWNPPQQANVIGAIPADTTIGGHPVGTYGVTATVEQITPTQGPAFLATVYRPDTETRQLPGVVFVHGAGTSDHRRFAPHATALASAGIVALVPDKPMREYTLTHRDYGAMARDYRQAVAYLRGDWQVASSQVGVYAESEGAYIAPIMTVIDPEIAFIALVSAPVVTPRQQAAFATDNYLRNTFVPAPLFHIIPRMLGVEFPYGSFDYADFPAGEYHRRVTCPVLMVYGSADPSMPLVQGPRELGTDLALAGNDQLTVRYYAGANHGIKIDQQLVEQFLNDTAAWILGLPATATTSPAIAGAQPVQEYQAITPPAAPWYMSGAMIIYTAAAGPVIAIGGAIIAAIIAAIAALRARFRGENSRGRPSQMQRTTVRLTTAALLAIVAAWVIYLAYLTTVARLALNYQTSSTLVMGGWGVVNLCAIGAILVLTIALRQLWQAMTSPVRFTFAQVVLIASELSATTLMCLLGAYWGLFSPLSLIA
ncbi:MAG: acyl-CoA thioester hydrolase/BAAT C-terminal domain-containing protein, partial [Bowdeniella nasicola]|nr:acyl-CoA thioester hydrolase/BAAT C-terminal domain-containing protein [Bowdeniella nasicola]